MRKALFMGVAAFGLLVGGAGSGSLIGSTAEAAEDCKQAVQLINRTQQNPGPSAANMANPMVLCPENFDKDGDGRLSRGEFMDMMLTVHSGLDEDGDGHISTDEINRLQPGDF